MSKNITTLKHIIIYVYYITLHEILTQLNVELIGYMFQLIATYLSRTMN